MLSGQRRFTFPRVPRSRRVIVVVIALATIFGGIGGLQSSRVLRVAAEETRSPFEQEEERESNEPSQESYADGRRRVRSAVDESDRDTAPIRLSTVVMRQRRSERHRIVGHRFTNGLTAPLMI